MKEKVFVKDDSLVSLNDEILDHLDERNEKKYTPSYIAKIINRSISDENYNVNPKSDLMKGHFIDRKDAKHHFPTANLKIGGELNIEYERGISLPSSFGRKIFKSLDEKISQIKLNELNEEELFRLAAFITVVIGTSHSFVDGSGRTSVGVAAYYLRKYSGHAIDFKQLEKSGGKLASAMSIGSHFLLPGEYKIDSVVEKLHKAGATEAKVIFPTPGSKNYLSFLSSFTDSIIEFINNFEIAVEENGSKNLPLFSLEKDSISIIVSLYKKASSTVNIYKKLFGYWTS